MPVLTADHLSKRYSADPVLRDVSFSLRRGEKVALVGVNGSGKSTLGRILGGVEEADTGNVARRKDVDFVYLPQEPVLDPTRTVFQEVEAALGHLRDVTMRYEALSEKLSVVSPEEAEALVGEQTRLATEIERLGGWDPRHRIVATLEHLGVHRGNQLVGELSGGERRRVALAKVLVASPGVAILDEPTNHLDADTAEWLEKHLREEFPGALLLITHDRYLLDRVVTRIVELDRGEALSYDGNYGAWVTQKAERMALEARTDARRMNLMRREQEWLSRGPAARTTKQKARINRAEGLRDTIARDRRSDSEVSLVATAGRIEGRLVDVRNVSKRYGDKTLFNNVNLTLAAGDRVGVVGANGAGKTTFLRVLLGQEQADSGEVVRGPNLRPVYLDQSRASLDDDKSILQNVADDADKVNVGGRWMDARGYLEQFLFDASRLRQPVGSLSGGERARVVLAKALQGEGNLLVLDEPTNDLDLATLTSLEEMLCDWPGCAVVVSHDRWFLNRVVTSILAFEGGGRVVHQAGDWETWRAIRDQLARQEQEVRATRPAPEAQRRATAEKPAAGVKPLSPPEQRELEKIPGDIDAAEAELRDMEAQLNDPMFYANQRDEVAALLATVESRRARLDGLMARWEELERRREATAKSRG